MWIDLALQGVQFAFSSFILLLDDLIHQLLHLGLTAERLLPPLSVLDPDAAPAAFYAANLLLFAASLFVGYPVLRDGLTGLRGRPSADTMPALAAVAALLQTS